MLLVSRPRKLMLLLVAAALTAATLATTAGFKAAGPDAFLSPVGNADQIVEILQGNRNILWSALEGSVISYRVEGWPVSIDGNDLGGALVIERPADRGAGIIEFGERPASLSFEIEP